MFGQGFRVKVKIFSLERWAIFFSPTKMNVLVFIKHEKEKGWGLFVERFFYNIVFLETKLYQLPKSRIW